MVYTRNQKIQEAGDEASDNIKHIEIDKLISEIADSILRHLKEKQPVEHPIQNGMSLLGGKKNCGGQGDCLFRSVAYWIGADHKILRELTATVIEKNQTQFGAVINSAAPETLQTASGIKTVEDVQTYANLMAKAGTWGGYIELYVLASMLNSPIVLLSDGYRPQIFRPHTTQERAGAPIFLYYDGHVHYQALLLREGADAQNILQQLDLLAHNDDDFQSSKSRKRKAKEDSEEISSKRRKTSLSLKGKKGKEEVSDESDSSEKEEIEDNPEDVLNEVDRLSELSPHENALIDEKHTRWHEMEKTCHINENPYLVHLNRLAWLLNTSTKSCTAVFLARNKLVVSENDIFDRTMHDSSKFTHIYDILIGLANIVRELQSTRQWNKKSLTELFTLIFNQKFDGEEAGYLKAAVIYREGLIGLFGKFIEDHQKFSTVRDVANSLISSTNSIGKSASHSRQKLMAA